MQERLFVLASVALGLLACGGRSRGGAWGEVDPGSEPPRASAAVDASSKAVPSASAASAPVCETPRFLDVKLGTGRSMPDRRGIRSVRLVEGSTSSKKRLTEEELSHALGTAAPLDSCDPSIPEFQYVPEAAASVELSDGTRLRLQIFGSARAALAWPDGTGVLFDFGDAAPWLPRDAQPFLRRDFAHDADCRRAEGRPHRIVYEPGPSTDPAPTQKGLGATCSRIGPAGAAASASSWCCP